ncbi:MAG: hypothetical protein IIB42_07705 [Candidatus Marinimicrobia bacterium]|nr:hypothetical protein [Candidatus Neomarinimicrobiota bacterium]
MRFLSPDKPVRGRIHFHRLRAKRWNKRQIWRYLILLVIIMLFFRLLKSL